MHDFTKKNFGQKNYFLLTQNVINFLILYNQIYCSEIFKMCTKNLQRTAIFKKVVAQLYSIHLLNSVLFEI